MPQSLRLIYVLTLANLRSRYRNTFYGFLWVIINPIITFAVQAYAFTIIFKIQYSNYSSFLLSGLLPWLFIVQSVEMCTGLFVMNAQFVKNLPVPPRFLVHSQVLDNFINFLCSFLLLLCYFFYQFPEKSSALVFLPLPVLSLFLAVASLCLILSSLNVMLRDLKFVTSFLFSVLFYLTPIFYPPQFIPAQYRLVVDLNPLYYIIRPFQLLIIEGAGVEFYQSLFYSFLVSAIILLLSIFIWKKMKRVLVLYA